MDKVVTDFDVVILGAGPAGCVAAGILQAKGYRVQVVERQRFPRFSIGESLLPQCMEFLEEAGLLEAVMATAEKHHFQYKNGATFVRATDYSEFDFRKKFSQGWGTTYQVQREHFDHVLALEIERKGVPIAWEYEVVGVDMGNAHVVVTARDREGKDRQFSAKFVLDGSGFGRVLPRLLDLDRPSDFPPRASLFTHVEDNIEPNQFDRDKIRITIHPRHQDLWYWLIPFANGRSSLGVVAASEFFQDYDEDMQQRLRTIVEEDQSLKDLLARAVYDTPVRQIAGYARGVSSLWGKHFALLGNAGEFLDPVFSSGVTIAMKSASLAASALDKQLQGQAVDWEGEYAQPLRGGIDTFRTFVEAWYDGRFQNIIFAENQSREVREMISSILAGYAWDQTNPYVKDSERRIDTLAQLCQAR